jgi:rhodanese-related sulfurtransferase
MDADAAHEAKDRFHVVDVREPFEWELGHVEGALHIPIQSLHEKAASLPTDKPLLFVCTVGMRSQYAADLAASAGYETENLDGGLVTWQDAGFPLVKDDGTEGTVWTNA